LDQIYFLMRDNDTWPVQLDKNRVLGAYYFSKNNRTRHIAGSILEIK